MLVAATVEQIRAARWADPSLTWGLVPTMGALHEGHLALVRRALAESDRVAVSIFVNPAQFNNPEDLKKYPRTLEGDLDQLRGEGVHLVWTPTEADVYPAGYQTYITVEKVTLPLEGAARPGHFRGVATVVAKLFNVFQPHKAYFGQKDAQQCAVIKQMARDLNFNVEVVICPTVREADGLAMSSRNTRLSPQERQSATVLYRALNGPADRWQSGERDADHLRALMAETVSSEPLARADYISIADPDSLEELNGEVRRGLFSMAVFIGEVRLIDNVAVGDG